MKKTVVVLLVLMLALTSIFAEGSKESSKAKKDELVTINFGSVTNFVGFRVPNVSLSTSIEDL